MNHVCSGRWKTARSHVPVMIGAPRQEVASTAAMCRRSPREVCTAPNYISPFAAATEAAPSQSVSVPLSTAMGLTLSCQLSPTCLPERRTYAWLGLLFLGRTFLDAMESASVYESNALCRTAVSSLSANEELLFHLHSIMLMRRRC